MGAPTSESGFTMVEIAICLGVIVFALVAIIGVLPTGMNAQRDNRYDTIINHDGTYWLEAIRTGAQGLDDLTNYVEEITTHADLPGKTIYALGPGGLGSQRFINGAEIIGLLTPLPGETNTAIVYAISGAAAEKELAGRDLGFKYEMSVTANNYSVATKSFDTITEELADDPQAVLYDLRISFRYALRGKTTGKGKAAYRTLVSVAPPVAGVGVNVTNFYQP